MGTAAHAFTLLHDSEEAAFRAQVDAFGPETTLLVDTYDIAKGVEPAVKVAGTELGAVRIDSGDLPTVVAAVRDQLDWLGAVDTRITVTSDLDEYTIAGLSGAPSTPTASAPPSSPDPDSGRRHGLQARRPPRRRRRMGRGRQGLIAEGERRRAQGRGAAPRLHRHRREELVFVGDGPDGEAEFEAGGHCDRSWCSS